MRVLLVNMPWASADVPSLALGILRRSVREQLPDAEAEVVHANLDYIDWVTRRTALTGDDYTYFAHDSYFQGCGDWVFSSALYGDPDWRLREFTELMGPRMPDGMLALATELHRTAPDFIRHLAQRIAARAPDVVGFTTTFQQNTAALAAARHLKDLAPDIVTVFGGANCDGAQGEALHRNFPCADFVLRGEGETAFPSLLRALRDGGPLDDVPGLCRRDVDGTSVAQPMSTRPLPPAAIVPPDYDGYFERFAASRAGAWSEPRLVVEGARGCWWGEKHHCTFCGLNGSFMQFRSKHPDVFHDEITGLVERHQVLDVVVVDNILDMNYLTTLLPRLAASGHDLRLHYEIKSNLRLGQLQLLADAGLVHVQPGIESLGSRTLQLMDKGVTGCQNVRMLRDSRTTGLVPEWNYLYGFPGETDQDYLPVIGQLPALHHLTPPLSASRIAIERFSPYFDRPELGFGALRPDPQYGLVHDLPEEELADLAYLFSAPERGIGAATAERLHTAVDAWRAAAGRSRLTHCDLGDRILLVSRRARFPWTVLRLDDPVELAVFRLLDQPRTPAVLAAKAGARAGRAVDGAEITALLDRWCALGLVFTDNGQFVHVVPAAVNQELLDDPSADTLPGSLDDLQPTGPVPAAVA
ncbi:RiPP maturation radical SAM C-methyltransferase [Streptomyces sp. NPDC006733]|uniref:RiPP maturation radical SAM C-methyltransferase n=1 Tax=Streptomyces sp. NPDC006733 TaxID=3155460 RepID=UPI0033F6EC7C